jgi:P27 family predicted phage terminase small subunit
VSAAGSAARPLLAPEMVDLRRQRGVASHRTGTSADPWAHHDIGPRRTGLYCSALADYHAAAELVERQGITIAGRDGGVVTNPAVRVRNAARLTAHPLGADFGLTPSARVPLCIEPPLAHGPAGERDAPLQALLSPASNVR